MQLAADEESVSMTYFACFEHICEEAKRARDAAAGQHVAAAKLKPDADDTVRPEQVHRCTSSFYLYLALLNFITAQLHNAAELLLCA
jgi:hypothetical protein